MLVIIIMINKCYLCGAYIYKHQCACYAGSIECSTSLNQKTLGSVYVALLAVSPYGFIFNHDSVLAWLPVYHLTVQLANS